MFTLLFALVSSTQACTYQLTDTAVYAADRYVFFGDYLNQQMQKKGYVQASQNEDAKYKVEMNFQTYDRTHFQFSHAKTSIEELVSKATFFRDAEVRCYTEICTAKDAAKAIKKSIDEFERKLPACQ
jgi:hypothetical protein